MTEFDGETYEPEHDRERLTTLLQRVESVMRGGQWMTLAEIKRITGGTEASISARLRDLRKSKFGGLEVERRRRGDPSAGLWEYRMTGDVRPFIPDTKRATRERIAELEAENAALRKRVDQLERARARRAPPGQGDLFACSVQGAFDDRGS